MTNRGVPATCNGFAERRWQVRRGAYAHPRMRTLALLAFALLSVWGAEPTPAVEAPSSTPARSKAALIVIDGTIDPRQETYFTDRLAAALDQGATIIVTRLTTDGGHLEACLQMVDRCLTAGKDRGKVRLVALVEGKAWSAGAMIAYAHHEIYLMPGSHIGDIGVITINAEGQIEYLPEKIESPVRAHLRTIAEANGWSLAKLQKMTARNQELYRFDLADGTQHFVIQDDLGTFLAAHPGLKSEDKILVLGEDRLISYTAKEAVEADMATGIVSGIDELWTTLGVDRASIIDLSPTSNERFAWTLAGFAPLLAGLCVLFIVFELKTPGVGIWAILAGCCAVLFFFCQFYLDLAASLEVILIVLGIAAIIVELFIFPTAGLLGVGGAMLAALGLVLAFVPDDLQFRPGADGYSAALHSAMIDSLVALVIGGVAMIYAIRIFPHTRAARRLAATGEITATSAGEQEIAAASLVGQRVEVVSPLRPAGTVRLHGDLVSAHSEHGQFLDQGTLVEVVAMRYGEAIVRPVAATEAQA